jgi:phosphatidate cytidylyltransferase
VTETHDRSDRPDEHRAAEGVRIIPADEAQHALEAGEASGRRPEDELRYGDVPPRPAGPRPPHRFPLPDSIDPAEAVPRPPVVLPPRDAPVVRASRAAAASSARRAAATPAASAGPADPDEGDSDEGDGSEGVRVLPAEPAPTTAQPPSGPGGQAGQAGDADGRSEPDGWIPEWDPSLEPDLDEPTVPEHVGLPLSTEAPPPVPQAPGRPVLGGVVPDEGLAEPPPIDPRPAAKGITGLRWAEPDLPEPADPPGRPEPPPTEPAPTSTGSTPTGSGRPGQPSYLEPPPPEPYEPVGVDEPLTAPPPDPTSPEEGITMTGATELPHWTEPPGASVPRGLTDSGDEDDLDAWNALSGRGARWRSEHDDWEDAGSDLDDLAGEDTRVGALDQDRSERSDLFSFDEAFERLEEERSGSYPVLDLDQLEGDAADATDEPVRPRRSARRPGATATRMVRSAPRPGLRPQRLTATPSAELGSRVGVGIALTVVVLAAYLVGSKALVVVSLAAVVAAAAESYSILQHLGGPEARSAEFSFRPATLLGLVATGGLMLGGYWKGPAAIPLVLAVTFVAVMAWYLLGVTDARPLANVAVTLMTVVWVGVLGSYAALLLREPRGRELFLGAVAATVLSDVVAYAVGRRIGRTPLAPRVSPGKTREGLVSGAVAAVVVGALVGVVFPAWGGVGDGVALGVVVAVLAPVGDLFESMIKRDLEVKDSGRSLAGHGGVLDRFDSILVVMPAAYYLALALHVA